MFLLNGLGQKIKRSLGLDDTLQPPYKETSVRKDQASYNQQFFNTTLAESAPSLPRQQPPPAKGLLPIAPLDSLMPHLPSAQNDEGTPHSSPNADSHGNAVNHSEDSAMEMRPMNGMSNLGASMASNSGQLNPRTQTALETAIVLSQQSTLSPSPNHRSAHGHSQNGSGHGAITVAASPSLPVVSKEMAEIAMVALRQAEVFIKQKKWEKAIQACDRTLSIDPTVAEAHKLMGNVLQYMGNPVDSISCYVEALVLKPQYPEVYANLGTVYSTLEDWEQAFEYYQKAIALNPEFVGAYRHLVKAWRQLNQPEEYTSKIQQAMIMAPEQFGPDEHCKMGDRLLKIGKEQDAIASFNRALSQQGDYTEAHQALAQILEKQGNWEQAVNHYNQVLDSKPSQTTKDQKKHPLPDTVQPLKPEEASLTEDQDARAISIDSLLVLARSYVRHDNFEKAVTHYKNALRLDPHAANIYQELADVLTQTGQPEQAIESWYRVVMLNSDWATPERCVQVGNQLLNQNQPSKAIDCYRRALNLDPTFTSAQEQLNSVLNSFSQSQVETASSYSSPSNHSVTTTIAHTGGAMPKKSDGTTNRHPQADRATLAMDTHKRGEELTKQDRWEEAIAAYRRAIKLNSDFSWSHHNLGDILRETKDLDGAVLSYQQAIALNSTCAWSHYNLGDVLFQLKQWDEATNAYQNALALDSTLPDLRIKIAQVLKLQAQHHLEQAQEFYADAFEEGDKNTEIYHHVLNQNPNNVDGYIGLADSLTVQENYNGAIAFYEIALQLDPQGSIIYQKLGQVLVKQKDFQSAVTVLQKAIDRGEQNYLSHYLLGLSLENLSRGDDAIISYKNAIAQNVNHFESLLRLGLLLNQKNDFSHAVEYLKQAQNLSTNNAELFTGLGHAYLGQEKLQDALQCCQQAVKLNPSSWSARRYLADVLRRHGRRTEAIAQYEQVINLNPRFPGAYNCLGDLYREQQTWEKAEQAYLCFLERVPNHFWAHQNLGVVLGAQKQWDAAITAYQKALAINPEEPKVLAKLEGALKAQAKTKKYERLLERGKNLKEEGELEDAEDFLREAIRVYPECFEAYVEMADILRTQGKPNQAVDLFLVFHRLCPDSPDIYHEYSRMDWENIDQSYLDKAIHYTKDALIEISEERHSLRCLINRTLGDIQTCKGVIEEAINSYKIAVRLSLPEFEHNSIKEKWVGQSPSKGPDFFVIGGMKCGTTSLFSYISQHPNVVPPLKKEIHFFSTDFDQYKFGLNWYLSHFFDRPHQEGFLSGEASPCMCQYGVANRVAKSFPNIKILVLLRNPIDRAWSHYGHNRSWYGQSYQFERNHNFEKAIEPDLNNKKLRSSSLKTEDIHRLTECYYIKLGMYFYFLKEWMSLFPQENFLILKSEKFYSSLSGSMEKVFNFLELPEFEVPNYGNKMKGHYSSMPVEIRRRLNNYYRPHNQRLEDLLGMELDWE